MNTLVSDARATTVTSTDDLLTVELSDGRVISAPLTWYPRLLNATNQERSNYRLLGLGQGIHWPELDEDISVENLLLGKPSSESQKSLQHWLERRKNTAKDTSELFETNISILSQLGEIILAINERTISETASMSDIGQKLGVGKSNREQSKILVAKLSSQLSSFAKFLSEHNDAYEKLLPPYAENMKSITEFLSMGVSLNPSFISDHIHSLHSLEESASTFRNIVSETLATMEQVPPLTDPLREARDKAVKEFNRLSKCLDHTVAIVFESQLIVAKEVHSDSNKNSKASEIHEDK